MDSALGGGGTAESPRQGPGSWTHSALARAFQWPFLVAGDHEKSVLRKTMASHLLPLVECSVSPGWQACRIPESCVVYESCLFPFPCVILATGSHISFQLEVGCCCTNHGVVAPKRKHRGERAEVGPVSRLVLEFGGLAPVAKNNEPSLAFLALAERCWKRFTKNGKHPWVSSTTPKKQACY